MHVRLRSTRKMHKMAQLIYIYVVFIYLIFRLFLIESMCWSMNASVHTIRQSFSSVATENLLNDRMQSNVVEIYLKISCFL